MKSRHRLFLQVKLACLGLCTSVVAAPVWAQTACLVIPAFFVQKPAEVNDLDEIALNFPRELAQKLADKTQYRIVFHAELPVFDSLSHQAPARALQQLSTQYQCPYVLLGEIKGAGIYTETLLFGLWDRKWRNFTVATRIVDSRSQQTLKSHEYAQNIKGEASPGRQLNFGGSGFATHAYGRIILEVLNDTAEALTQDLQQLNSKKP